MRIEETRENYYYDSATFIEIDNSRILTLPVRPLVGADNWIDEDANSRLHETSQYHNLGVLSS